MKLVQSLEQRFNDAGIDNARRTAEELLAEILGCKPLEIYLDAEPLSEEQIATLNAQAARIMDKEPLQYVIGHVDFMGMEIKCDPRALIPRPETELLVEEILNSAIWSRQAPVIMDVGTGTGCIVLSLALAHPAAKYIAADLSPASLELARENARTHGLEERIQWRINHLLNSIDPASCDAVVANLPYIATSDWQELSSAVRDHEPRSALDSGPGGMELIEELATQARTVLVPGGMLFLEFGYDQGGAVSECLHNNGYRDIHIKKDLAGHDRMAIAENPSC